MGMGLGSLMYMNNKLKNNKNLLNSKKSKYKENRKVSKNNSLNQLKFKDVSDEELASIKSKIRETSKLQKRKSIVLNIVLFISVIALLLFLYFLVK